MTEQEPYWLIKCNDKYWTNKSATVWVQKSKAFKFYYKDGVLASLKELKSHNNEVRIVKISPATKTPIYDTIYANIYKDGYIQGHSKREDAISATDDDAFSPALVHTAVPYISLSHHNTIMADTLSAITDIVEKLNANSIDIDCYSEDIAKATRDNEDNIHNLKLLLTQKINKKP